MLELIHVKLERRKKDLIAGLDILSLNVNSRIEILDWDLISAIVKTISYLSLAEIGRIAMNQHWSWMPNVSNIVQSQSNKSMSFVNVGDIGELNKKQNNTEVFGASGVQMNSFIRGWWENLYSEFNELNILHKTLKI